LLLNVSRYENKKAAVTAAAFKLLMGNYFIS